MIHCATWWLARSSSALNVVSVIPSASPGLSYRRSNDCRTGAQSECELGGDPIEDGRLRLLRFLSLLGLCGLLRLVRRGHRGLALPSASGDGRRESCDAEQAEDGHNGNQLTHISAPWLPGPLILLRMAGRRDTGTILILSAPARYYS